MKKALIILVSLLILGGAITGSMKSLELGPFAPKTAEVIKVVEELEPIFIDMEPILIPIFKGNRPVAKIQIQIKLETKSTEKAIKIQRMMPRISDTFVKDLHSFMPRLLKEKERIDDFILKQRLKLMLDRNFGKGLIDDVLIQSVTDTSN
jgi:flagellar basal body-associated protein FliL